MSTSAEAPYPPLTLANRVCSLKQHHESLAAYERLGAEARGAIMALLPEGWSFAGKRALDFGCGAGRTLRQFLAEAEQGAEMWGSDIDGSSIAWLQANLCPPLHAVENGIDPPLGFDAASFDLIWALSVFTHLTDNSLPWLVELHRLLKPGGMLLATYMGRYNGEAFTEEPWDEDRIGMNVLRHDQDWDEGGPMVLMSDWWVESHWGRAFEILNRAPVHGQTWILLRKREVVISAAELERPENDSREYRALRHNVRQVERDRERLLGEVIDGYERSPSWRLTAPLRAAKRFVRGRRAIRLR